MSLLGTGPHSRCVSRELGFSITLSPLRTRAKNSEGINVHLDILQRIWLRPPIARSQGAPLIRLRVSGDKLDLVDHIVNIGLQLVLGDDRPVGEVSVVTNGDTIPDTQNYGLRYICWTWVAQL